MGGVLASMVVHCYQIITCWLHFWMRSRGVTYGIRDNPYVDVEYCASGWQEVGIVGLWHQAHTSGCQQARILGLWTDVHYDLDVGCYVSLNDRKWEFFGLSPQPTTMRISTSQIRWLMTPGPLPCRCWIFTWVWLTTSRNNWFMTSP